jgi:hypothetical protein
MDSKQHLKYFVGIDISKNSFDATMIDEDQKKLFYQKFSMNIEGFKKGAGRKFFDITSKSKKPIIVYKAGRTEVGKMAAQSHTASIAGEYEVAKAAMKQAGLVVADSMIDHGDFIKTFALLNDFKVAGKSVVVVTNAGYENKSNPNGKDQMLPLPNEESQIKANKMIQQCLSYH